MRHAAEAIDAGEVTQAVRESRTAVGPVAEGDWLAIARGDGIVAVAPDVVAATTALLDAARRRRARARHADHRRRRRRRAPTASIEAWMAVNRPGVDIEVHDGGQPLYPYLVGVE